jgi:hypothetical protein
MAETGLNGLHGLYTIKRLFICHELLGKSGIRMRIELTAYYLYKGLLLICIGLFFILR